MARKSIEFEVVFYVPKDEKGKILLAKTLGEVHSKLIKEIINRKVDNVSQKNKMISEVQKKVMSKLE